MRRDAPTEPAPSALGPVPDHLSWSQVRSLSSRIAGSCPRRWAYEKLLGLPSTSSAAMVCGTVLDRGVGAFFLQRMAGAGVEPARLHAERTARAEAQDIAWPAGVDIEAHTELVIAGLWAFCEAHVDTIPVSVQTPHSFTVRATDGELVTVIGYSDWLLADGTVVELKWSGITRWDRDGVWRDGYVASKRDQLTVYYMGRLAGGIHLAPVVPRGRLVVVQHNRRQRTPQVRSLDVELGADDVERLVADIREADEVARSGVHPPSPGDHCGRCAYMQRCADDLRRRALRTERLVA